MLDFIRRNAGSWLIKFILFAIAVVFIFWGIGTFRSQRLEIAASVNDDAILVETYRHAYANALERYREMFQGQIPEGLLKQLNIEKQVLDGLIDDALIGQSAAAMGILVSDEEIRHVILSIPAFQHNGVFDKVLYERALRSSRLTPAGFEAQVRRQLLTDKVRSLITAGLTVPEGEAREYYQYENEEINIEYVVLDAAGFEKGITLTEQDIAGWYDATRRITGPSHKSGSAISLSGRPTWKRRSR